MLPRLRLRPASLLFRTSLTLGVSALAIAAISIWALSQFVIAPIAEQSAEDEAALLVLSAQTWVELPPPARPYYELELFESHQLVLSPERRPLQLVVDPGGSLGLLESALSKRLREPIGLFQGDDLIWAEIPMGGVMLQLGFAPDRGAAAPWSVVLVIFAAGAVIVFFASLLIVQRIVRPLEAVASSAEAFRGGAEFDRLPETGPQELVALTRSFNTMAEEISALLANRTTLLAGVSHDLRTPLARMRLVLELMGDGIDGDLRERMARNMDAMEALLSKGLKFARGLAEGQAETVELGAHLARLVNTQAEPLLSFENRLREPRTVRLAVEALDRVLENLMNNALAYSGAPVVLRLKESAKGLKVQVLDRGPGIPEGERQRVFQPFYRLEQSRSLATGGSGLGLAIVKQLCDAQGWRIEVTEHGGGGGAVFTVTLPPSVQAA